MASIESNEFCLLNFFCQLVKLCECVFEPNYDQLYLRKELYLTKSMSSAVICYFRGLNDQSFNRKSIVTQTDYLSRSYFFLSESNAKSSRLLKGKKVFWLYSAVFLIRIARFRKFYIHYFVGVHVTGLLLSLPLYQFFVLVLSLILVLAKLFAYLAYRICKAFVYESQFGSPY